MEETEYRNFYDASEAYRKAKQAKEQIEKNQLIELFDKIDEYVKIAQFDCDFEELSAFQKKWLEDNGYEVNIIEDPSSWKGGYFNIKWNKK